jgi:nucleotide-binding universal stress UspA family protein
MSYKTVLVHWDASQAARTRLAIAAELAQRFGGHLLGIYTRPSFRARVVADEGFPMGDFYRAYEENAKADHAAAATAFTDAIKDKDISSEWRVLDSGAYSELISLSLYVDLIVVGQRDPASDASTPLGLPETVALFSGRPILVVPRSGIRNLSANIVLLCWNGSRESARAATEALPLLKAARRVYLLVATAAPVADAGVSAAAWLGRHGVKATIQHEVAADAEADDLIKKHAADCDADLVVMGLYGHSRLREIVLGGASRALLAEANMPLFMAH